MTKPQILLVDDEPANLATFQAFLGGGTYEVRTAASGREAMLLARQHPPDLVLLDVMMPEMDGFAVCRDLRGDPVLGRVPIIMVTALDDDASRLEGLRMGADDFLTKPCSREELCARVRTVVSLNRFRLIAEQQSRFEQLYELAPAGILLVDRAGVIVDANVEARALLAGENGSSLALRPIGTFFCPDSAERVSRAVAQAIKGETVPHCEVRTPPGPNERILHLRAARLKGAAPQPALLLFDDVTAEARARAALQEANDRLEAAVRARTQQLAEANELLMSYANFVSHDLRSPLTVAKGFLSLIHGGVLPINREAAEAVEHAYSATLLMQELVENILQLAREEHGAAAVPSISYCEAEPIVRRVWAHLQCLRSKPCGWTLGKLPAVAASTVLVERVFYNLLANAQKHSATAAAPEIEVGVAGVADGMVTFFVRDNGAELEGRNTAALFAEYSRPPFAIGSEGFGLGIALVARLVRLHGGRIWAREDAGAGATFFLTFPAAGEPNRPRGPGTLS